MQVEQVRSRDQRSAPTPLDKIRGCIVFTKGTFFKLKLVSAYLARLPGLADLLQVALLLLRLLEALYLSQACNHLLQVRPRILLIDCLGNSPGHHGPRQRLRPLQLLVESACHAGRGRPPRLSAGEVCGQ